MFQKTGWSDGVAYSSLTFDLHMHGHTQYARLYTWAQTYIAQHFHMHTNINTIQYYAL